MVITKIFDPLRIALISIAVFTLFLAGFMYIYRGLQKEKSNERLLMYGMACVLIFSLALVKLFQLLADTEIYGYYIGHDYYGDFYVHSTIFEVYGKIANIFTAFGFLMFLFFFELSLKRTKYIITMISLIMTIITIIFAFIFPIVYLYNLELITSPFLVFTFYFMIVWITKNAELELKSISGAILLGYFFLIIGFSSLDGIEVKEASSLTLHIGPILGIIGSFIFITPLILKVTEVSQIKRLWILITIGTSILTVFTFIFYFAFYITNTIIFGSIYVAFYFVGLVIIFRSFNTEHAIAVKDKTLSIFSRPERLTEEEISISKEKKTCIVCKGGIGGINFMCKECGAFYCNKCYTALTDLENACWLCDTILDGSKPRNLERENKEEIALEKERLKNKNVNSANK